MKITLENADKPFQGSIIEIANLISGFERFRIHQYPMLGRYLWDGNKTEQVEHPFDGDKFLQETGIDVAFQWFEGSDDGKSPKVLGRIFIGSRWTGPLFNFHSTRGGVGLDGSNPEKNDIRVSPCFSNGNYGKSYAGGGTWRGVLSINDTYRDSTPEEIASGKGQQTHSEASIGFQTFSAAFDYRFNRSQLLEHDKNRCFTESSELVDYLRGWFVKMGLMS